MSEHRYGSDCSCPDCRIADLREQFAAVTAERDEARKEVADWLEVYPRFNKNMLAMGQMLDDAIARAEAAEAQTAYADETVRQTPLTPEADARLCIGGDIPMFRRESASESLWNRFWLRVL